MDALVKKYGAEAYFTPKEAAYIKNTNADEKDQTNFSWRHEDYWMLLWALGYVDKLDFPKSQCEVPKAVNFLASRTTETFIATQNCGTSLPSWTKPISSTGIIEPPMKRVRMKSQPRQVSMAGS